MAGVDGVPNDKPPSDNPPSDRPPTGKLPSYTGFDAALPPTYSCTGRWIPAPMGPPPSEPPADEKPIADHKPPQPTDAEAPAAPPSAPSASITATPDVKGLDTYTPGDALRGNLPASSTGANSSVRSDGRVYRLDSRVGNTLHLTDGAGNGRSFEVQHETTLDDRRVLVVREGAGELFTLTLATSAATRAALAAALESHVQPRDQEPAPPAAEPAPASGTDSPPPMGGPNDPLAPTAPLGGLAAYTPGEAIVGFKPVGVDGRDGAVRSDGRVYRLDTTSYGAGDTITLRDGANNVRTWQVHRMRDDTDRRVLVVSEGGGERFTVTLATSRTAIAEVEEQLDKRPINFDSPGN